MPIPSQYIGREQAYVKHTFLKNYLESLAFKTASKYSQIVYVDGFAGPWQSSAEKFQDTSFGIALEALRSAKARWKVNRDVAMSAHLVERSREAYSTLSLIPNRYPDVSVKTYNADFMTVLPEILRAIPRDAFTFFFLDPKGWRIPLEALKPLLQRPNSEVIFNFMFDFINRAASIDDPAIQKGLDELMPFGAFREKLANIEASNGRASDIRREILVSAFGESLARLGGYPYVAETTVLRPIKDRPLYCLFYATRHSKGMEVFRDHQVRALLEQSKTRAVTKIKFVESASGQGEIFQSLHEMAPNEVEHFLETERTSAELSFLSMLTDDFTSATYGQLWPKILARHVIRLTDLNKIAARLRKEGKISFPGWEKRRQVPQSHYHVHRIL